MTYFALIHKFNIVSFSQGQPKIEIINIWNILRALSGMKLCHIEIEIYIRRSNLRGLRSLPSMKF